MDVLNATRGRSRMGSIIALAAAIAGLALFTTAGNAHAAAPTKARPVVVKADPAKHLTSLDGMRSLTGAKSAQAFDSSGYLHVSYACDYYANLLHALYSQPYLGTGLATYTDFYARRSATWVSCTESSHNWVGHACYGTYEIGGVDNNITGWARTDFRCV